MICAGLPVVLFFANASRDSTDGRRVRQFRRRLRCGSTSTVLYRDDRGKWRSILQLLRAARDRKPDLVYVELFGASGLIGGVMAKLLFGARLAIGNGDEVFSTHLKNGRRTRAAVAWAAEWLLLRYADLWAAWSPYQVRALRARGARNVVCVPGAVDVREMAPCDASDLRRRLDLDGRFVVGVVGHLSYCRKLGVGPGWDLIEALTQLRDLPVAGLIVGEGPGLARLRELAAEKNVANRVVFTGHVPHALLPSYYSAMQVGLVTLSNDRDGRFTWTAKLPEYLACNVFAIMSDVDRSRSFVRRCGALLPFQGAKDPTYPARLAGLLRELVQQPEMLARRTHGRRVARSLLGFDVAARHLGRGMARALRAAPASTSNLAIVRAS
jgi:glycosyltransferase involved in cell wall biosynthesis